MGFVRSYFFTNETLGRWTLFSSKLDSPVIKTLETHFFTLSECVSNVLITGESNFDEKMSNCPEFCVTQYFTGIKMRFYPFPTKKDFVGVLMYLKWN